MAAVEVTCTNCDHPIAADVLDRDDGGTCSRCNSELRAYTFPALHIPLAGGHTGDHIVVDGTSSCFYHENKQAVRACDDCGRFLCALCDVGMGEKHLCPRCIESGARKGKVKDLQRERTLYDRLALAIAVYPILTLWLTVVTAPIALYMVFRYWKAPVSIVGGSRVRMVIAGVVASLQIIVWLGLFVFLLMQL